MRDGMRLIVEIGLVVLQTQKSGSQGHIRKASTTQNSYLRMLDARSVIRNTYIRRSSPDSSYFVAHIECQSKTQAKAR
jgi:hypothetical protein